MFGRIRLTRWFYFALGIALSVTSSSFADGVIRDGLGAISIGRGGANIAHSDNAEIILDNPAGMVNVKGAGLAELSIDILLTDLHYSDPQNNVAAEVKPYPMGQLGFIHRDPTGLWAFGFGVFAPAGFGAEWDVVHPDFGLQRQKSFGALVKVLPSFAISLTDKLSVGASVGVAASHAELEGPFHLQSGPIPGAPALLDLQATGASVAWNLGLQYKLSPCTTLGVSYTGETRMSLDGNARTTVPGLGFSSFDAEVDIAWPRSVGIGLAHAPCRHRRFSLDVIWYNWASAFDSVGLTFTNPSNQAFAGFLGNVFHDSFPLNWQDSISVRTGYEHFLSSSRVVRFGYVFHNNPIPDSTLTSFIPATLEHAASMGYGWRCGDWNVDVAYQFSWGRPREVGTSAILGGDFNNSRTESAAHWTSISFVRKF